jgi:hypothetical protein
MVLSAASLTLGDTGFKSPPSQEAAVKKKTERLVGDEAEKEEQEKEKSLSEPPAWGEAVEGL